MGENAKLMVMPEKSVNYSREGLPCESRFE